MPFPHTLSGYLPDPKDPRDLNCQTLFAASQTLVEAIDWRDKVPDILDQGRLGSCVAHGVLGAIRLKHVFDGIEKPLLGNRLHVYRGARAYIGTGEWDSGSHIRDAFRFTNAVGFMPEAETDNGYDISKYTELPNPREMRLMHDQRNKQKGQVEYYRIYDQGNARKLALQKAIGMGGIPVMGTQTTRKFLEYRSGILRRPDSKESKTGGHAFYAVGYTPDYVICANSWDDDWGMNGFFYLGWDWVMWDATQDIWIVNKAPYYSHLLAA